MPEQLTQSQIDALLNKMSTGGELEVEEDLRKIKEYDFTSPKKFTKEQLKALDGLHETFSRMLSSYLSGLLRSVCTVEVNQIEELRYYEYNNALPDNSLIGIVDFRPQDRRYSESTLMMDMSTTLGFYLVDRLLGGPGSGYDLSRDYTDIEVAILTNVFEKITSRLQDAWSNNMAVETKLSSIETNSRLLQVFSPDDIVVVVILTVKLGSLSGNLSICLPAESMEEVVDNFTARYARTTKRQDPEREQAKRRLILENVLDSNMEMQAVFDRFSMDLKDVLQLQPQDVIPLGKNISSDILVWVEGVPWFSGKLGETKGKKSVKLNKPFN